jgi:hypothetical protein
MQHLSAFDSGAKLPAMAEGIVIQSRSRRVALQSPPCLGFQSQAALVPDGATDQQVLSWTLGWLPEAAWEELRALLSEEAERLASSSS